MLPTVVANELRDAVSEFLRSAFPIANPYFQNNGDAEPDPHALIDNLLDRPGTLFKGPYLDIKLPFRLAEGGALPFRHLTLPFSPYQHQLLAFQRLAGDQPQSTIVATGTGSGKTECFMLPVLDDCLSRRVQGIKTIVIYPMNALATDQAKRFAREVAKLDTRLTVGLFVGGEQSDAHRTMGPDNVITCQNTMRKSPPDILLTNYKMLDFLLIRPKDQPLWRFNQADTLRYLIVDELHTFDGAQGTDLACLIRRLRRRLQAGSALACVGTSATIGEGSSADLLRYAAEIFAAEFTGTAAIITEDRLTPDEYLLGKTEAERDQKRQAIAWFHWPDGDDARLNPAQYPTAQDYIFHQTRLWFAAEAASALPKLDAKDAFTRAAAAVELGELLHRHQAFHELIRAADKLRDLNAIAERWQQQLNLTTPAQARQLLTSMLSLLSAARVWNKRDSDDPDRWCSPLLNVRQQLWLRELRRLVCEVAASKVRPKIAFADDLQNLEKPLHLPLLHCRECNLAAWGTVIAKGGGHVRADLQMFYQAWFGYSPQAHLLVPCSGTEPDRALIRRLCPSCLRLQAVTAATNCVECNAEELVDVWMPDMLKPQQKGEQARLQCHHHCPQCDARDAMIIVGYRAASLISVMTARLFATPYNDDYKLIAFSDSVQDAAHRAGFLGANTWRQVVRQAMVNWLQKQSVALTLREMADLLPGRWRDDIGHDAKYCGLFIPPNLEYRDDYQKLRETGVLRKGSDLPDWVSKRLAWECIAEFGRRSGFGRSLERTGAAVTGLALKPLLADIEAFAQRSAEEIESLRGVDGQAYVHFVLGWLLHLRKIGAIYDAMLESYLKNKGNRYLINKLPWMPGFGRSQQPPAAVTMRHVAESFEALIKTTGDTWSVHWLKKTLGHDAVFVAAEARQVFHLLLQRLTKAGWLIEREAGGESLWLLNPDRLLIDRNVSTLACDQCRHRVQTTRELLPRFQQMPCLRHTCRGHLQPIATPLPTRDYGHVEPRRLVPSEHTGLLPRPAREAIEHSFINGHQPWDINLLSATPTLEMGIDIGDLSSVFLCSVPPAQANYLQRIGRAGRRDGNALAVTVANGKNHDLYFYANPLEMMAGAVQTPGVFLKAIAVLERQLTAYCFDRWAASGIDESAIPGILGKVLDAVEYSHLQHFPYNLLEFISQHRATLLIEFFGLFEQLDESAKGHLEQFIHDRGDRTLQHILVNRLQELVKERASLRQKIKQLKQDVENLKKAPQDDATRVHIQEVEGERRALMGLSGSLTNQQVLNFFTDEGLLPNYAFPEEGVTLRSVILRRRSVENQPAGDSITESRYEKVAYTFQRPAQAALSELAPESRFYAVSHEMEIDQIDLQLSESQLWRFCDCCQHTERVDIQDRHSACPCCGSAQWADSGQKHRVLKLRQVYSTVDDRSSRIGDDSEQRSPAFFNRQMLVNIAPQSSAGGFRIKSESLPFGFEYLQRATFREVNFGQAGGDTHNFAVAGREMPRSGFHVCRHCGKVQKSSQARRRQLDRPHTFTCKFYKNPDAATEEDFFSSLYLFREMDSEAIRILLPLSEVAYSDEMLHSFIAALNLGLRAYFHGNVHHLEVTDMREPPTADSGERIYLVVYDRIPGGTGYLKELMRAPENLIRVLEMAWKKLSTCECIDEEDRDGCYRCILAYRDSRNLPTISRTIATKLLADILELRDQMEPVTGLNNISTNVLIESKLEQKFVDALGELPGARMIKAMINGKAGSQLSVPGEEGKPVLWQVEHQVVLGPEDGVAVQTAVDVMLTPFRAEDVKRFRPIAVYLDGLQYHHAIVDDDVCKRWALLLSERYWVISLNWDDIPGKGKAVAAQALDIMRVEGSAQAAMLKLFDGAARRAQWTPSVELAAGYSRGGLDWLETLLRNPAQADQLLRQRATLRALTALTPGAMADAAVRQTIQQECAHNAPPQVIKRLNLDDPQQIPGGFLSALGNKLEGIDLTVTVPTAVMKSGNLTEVAASAVLHLCFDDRNTVLSPTYKDAWRGFWHAVNSLQFLPGFSMASRRAVQTGRLQQVESMWVALQQPAEEQFAVVDQSWEMVFELSVLDIEVLRKLADLALPVPEVGADLSNDNGEVVMGGDVVELCWRKAQVAIVNQLEGESIVGWRFIEVDGHLLQTIENLIAQGIL